MKSIKLYLLFFGIIVSAFSCNNENDNLNWQNKIESTADMFSAFDKEITLESEVYINDTLMLNNPFKLTIFDKYLIINDKDDNKIYSIYDMNRKLFICRFLNRGKGANEYISSYLNKYNNDTLMILDNNRQKLSFFSNKQINNCNYVPGRTILFKKKNVGDHIEKCFRYKKYILATGQFKEKRYYLFNQEGVVQKSFGHYPKVYSKVEFDNYHLGFIFGGDDDINFKSDFSKFASLTSVSLEIFEKNDMKNSFINVFRVIWQMEKIKEATYKNGKPYVIRFGNGEKIGAGLLASNDSYLFFPFSKYEYLELYDMGMQDYYGYIFVTDWFGKPIAKLKLDKRIQFSIAIDRLNNYLYAIHTNIKTGFSEVIRYDISFLKKFKIDIYE